MPNVLRDHVLRAGVLAGAVAVLVFVLSQIPIIGLCFSLLGWVIFLGAGIVAVMWGQGGSTSLTIQRGAIDGAVAGGIAGLIAHLVNWVVGGLLLMAIRLGFMANPRAGILRLSEHMIVGLVGVIIGVIIAVILGAIGGAVYSAMRRQPTPPATSESKPS